MNKMIKCSSLRHKRRSMFYGSVIMNRQAKMRFSQKTSLHSEHFYTVNASSNFVSNNLYNQQNSLTLKKDNSSICLEDQKPHENYVSSYMKYLAEDYKNFKNSETHSHQDEQSQSFDLMIEDRQNQIIE